MLKNIVYTLLALLLLSQLIPKPKKNIPQAQGVSYQAIELSQPMPKDVQSILRTSCYDCHSNTTVYPWYSNFQPVAWWLGKHIDEGKGELNFDAWGGYRLAKKYHKLEEIAEQVEEGEMPLKSYTLIHTNAKLSSEQKDIIVNWAKQAMDSMKVKYPADSLIMPKRK